MLEPTFLSVPELADRWKQTERQILERGAAMRLPLYFMFDGVAIPINDRWHLSHGHEYQDALRERESLEQSISLARGELARNAAILRGHSEPSPYEDMPLSTERKNALVARIEAEEAKLEAVTLRLEKRERTRRRYECNGILRIMPGAAKAIMIEGKAFVDRAYLPGKPLTLRQEQGGFILDGPILALEGGRVRLSQGDLLASLAEVKAIESGQTQKQRKAPPKHSETKSWQEQARQIANELDQRDASVGAHDSITSMAERVAIEMRNRGINGPRGPLSGATIKREALQGKRNMTPPVGWGKRGE